MRRSCQPGFVVSVGVLLVPLCLAHAYAQGPAPQRGASDSTVEESESARELRLRNTASQKAVRAARALEPIPSGAGSTGFVSRGGGRRPAGAGGRPAARRTGAVTITRPAAVIRPGAGPPVGVASPPTPTVAPGASPLSAGGLPASPGLSAGVPPSTPLLQRRWRPVVDEDPFGPIGVRVGSWNVKPSVEVMGGVDSNPGRVPSGRSSPVLIVSPDIEMRSDWRRHEGFAILRGSYTAYERLPELNRPNLELRAGGRVDVNSRARIDLEGRYLISTESPGSPDVPAGLSRFPKVTTIGGTATVAQRFNRLEIALKGSVDRVTYDDSVFTDGTVVSNESRQYNQYATALRTSYDLSPGMKPFAEVGVDTRKHDLDVDLFGFRRNSDGVIPKVGTTFELAGMLIGEASVGYLVRRYEDDRLEDLRGLIADVSMVWRASALTMLKLTARSTADETTVPGVSGILRRDFGVQLDHAFRLWLIGTAKLGYGTDTFEGGEREDKRYAASVGLIYKATRSVHVKGELRQEWLRSNVPGVDYTATIALAGLRFQR